METMFEESTTFEFNFWSGKVLRLNIKIRLTKVDLSACAVLRHSSINERCREKDNV